MGDHAGAQALAPEGEQAEQGAEQSDSRCRAYAFVKMANAEDNGLEKDGQGAAADDGLELLLQVAAKRGLLAESGGKRERDPRETLQSP